MVTKVQECFESYWSFSFPWLDNCNLQVLSEDENNVKALFRRGKAKAALGQTDAAREDFLKAKKYAPEDKAIAKELRLLAEHDKALYQKQKEIYKGIFGPRPEPKPKQSNWLILIWLWLLSVFHRIIMFFKRERQKSDWWKLLNKQTASWRVVNKGFEVIVRSLFLML